jgi:hypothetical protein
VGHAIFDACAQDPTCSAKLGAHPWDKVVELVAETPSQRCTGFERVRAALTIYADVPGRRDALPAFVYRMLRCSDDDVTAITHFKTHYFENASNGGGISRPPSIAARGSEVLQDVIADSELITTPFDGSALLARDKSLSFSAQYGLLYAGYFLNGFTGPNGSPAPAYPVDEYYGQYPTFANPMLIFNGTLDPSTPIDRARVPRRP